MQSDKLPDWLQNMNPMVRNTIGLALAGGAIVGILLLGPLHGVFGHVEATSDIEYGSNASRLAEYLKSPDDSVQIDIKGEVNTMQVGQQSVPVTLSKWFITNDTEAEVTVRDTQAPEIKLKSDKVSSEVGYDFVASDNIESVTDPVDGELAPVTEEPEAKGTEVGTEVFYDSGWYLTEAPSVLKKSGTRDVEVVACDRNGNRTTSTFSLVVVNPLKGVKLNKISKILEYGKDPLDALSAVKCSDPKTKVTAKDIDVSKIGKKVVTYNLQKHKSTRSVKRTFFVYDTQVPKIEIGSTNVKVDQYEAYDVHSNVVKVEDPVDGPLSELVGELPEAKGTKIGREVFYDEGFYTITGTVDTNTIGDYPITLTAIDKHGNEVKIDFSVSVIDPLEDVTLTARNANIEYGQGSIDPTTLVTCSDSSVQVSAPALSTSKLGSKSVTFTLRKGQSTRTVKLSFTVRDTQTPNITLGNGTVTINAGSSFDPYSNVRSVTDPADGRLTRVNSIQSKPGSGWYTITGSYDTSRAGKYALQVVACDRNGNQSTQSFTLVVK